MSLIHDALRRARIAQAKPPDSATGGGFHPQPPAALRLDARSPRDNASGRRVALGVAVIIAGLAVGAWGFLKWRAAAPPRAAVAQRTPTRVPATPIAPAAPAPRAETGAQVAAATPPPGDLVKPKTPDADAARPPQPRARAAAPVAPRPLPATPSPALTVAAVTTTPTAPPVDHFALAVRYQSLGNFEQALQHYTAALQADEFNVEARNNLGLLYRDHGLLNEAIDQFRRAVSINPQYLKARSNLAVTLTDAGRLAEAGAELRAALAAEPRNVDLLVNLALVQKADHHPDAAQETLVRALGINPKHAVAHYNLALLYEEKGERAPAYDHYLAFLQYAGPELGGLLSDVQQRADALRKQLDIANR